MAVMSSTSLIRSRRWRPLRTIWETPVGAGYRQLRGCLNRWAVAATSEQQQERAQDRAVVRHSSHVSSRLDASPVDDQLSPKPVGLLRREPSRSAPAPFLVRSATATNPTPHAMAAIAQGGLRLELIG